MKPIKEMHPEAGPLYGSEHKVYYPALDGLRALAVTMVFAAHTGYLTVGWAGVDIFFVLSGFLITGILWDSRNDPHRFRSFYLRRSLRIFPVYYAVWLTLLLTTPLLHFRWNGETFSWLLYFANWNRYFHLASYNGVCPWGVIAGHIQVAGRERTPFAEIGHFWSLCVEEQFYLLWPLIVFCLATKKRILAACATAVVCIPIMRFAAYFLLPKILIENDILYCLTIFRGDSLLLGGFLAVLLRSSRVERSGWWLFSASSLCLAAMYGLTSFRHPPSMSADTGWMSTVGFTFVDLAAAGLLLLALDTKSWVFRLLCLKPLRWLGTRSYGFYVYHFPVLTSLHVFAKHMPDRDAQFIITVAGLLITLGVSALSFRYLEKPFLRLKDRAAKTPVYSPSPA